MSSNKSTYVPKLITKKEALYQAKQKIEEEATGKQLGLKCRFSKLNIALGKYFRFKQVTSINGLSGHGKSTLLKILLEDFQNDKLNGNFNEPVIIVHNSWEMMSEDEGLRVISDNVKISYLYLLSSEYIRDESGIGGSYNKLNQKQLDVINSFIENTEDKDHYYFEEATTLNGIIININSAIDFYRRKYDKEIEAGFKPNTPKVVVALDHTLLLIGQKGQSVIDLMMGLARLAVYLKKKGYMVIFVGQFNNEIERLERIKNKEAHFPIKSDIYAQAQLYNACDNVLTIHQPELLGIIEYGRNSYVSKDLIHLQVLKQRFGKVGSIWLKNELHKGRLIEFQPESKAKK